MPSLTVDDSTPYVNVGVVVTATVTKNGSPAPDGTMVEFLASGGGLFPAYFSNQASVATQGGSASILFYATSAGAYVVQARVVDAYKQVAITYREHSPSDNLQIFLPLVPAEGDREGHEQVTMTGKGILPPAEVTFTIRSVQDPTVPGRTLDDGSVLGGTFEGRTINVQASEPLSSTGSITVETPEFTTLLEGRFDENGDGTVNGSDRPRICFAYKADIRVDVGVGLSGFQSASYIEAFTILPQSDPACDPTLSPGDPPPPEIYLLVPDHGSARGGEQITVLGRNFGEYLNEQLHQWQVVTSNSVQVEFLASDRTLLGIDPVVSPDGHQITVTTPRYGAQLLDTDQVVAVRVTNILVDEAEFPSAVLWSYEKPDAFVFVADQPTPEILSLAPTAGPIDGGTVVTIFGHGFQFPVQVKFGDLEAIVNRVNDDPTAADNDSIICVTPNYSTQGQVPPIAVTVRVTNTLSGKFGELASAFIFGANLFISGNSPSDGGPGTLVTIYGNGFEDPLVVDFLGTDPILRLESPAVSGTEVIARFPSSYQTICADATGAFRVTLTEQPVEQGVVEGGEFTLLGNTPTVTSVQPSIVQETLGGAGVTPREVTIYGIHFADELLVAITGSQVPQPYTLQTGQVSVVSEEQIDISNLPAPNDFNLTWKKSSCVTTDGFPGQRRIPTAVNIQVTNIPANCSSTLAAALIYNPESSDCEAVPTLEVRLNGAIADNGGTFSDFAETEAGSCSPGVAFLVRNNGVGDLDVSSASLGGPFYFTSSPGGGGSQSLPAFTVPQFGAQPYEVYYCPTDNDQLLQFGLLAMVSNDGGDPNSLFQVSLAAQEGRPLIETNPAPPDALDFPSGTTSNSIRISNNGVDDLNWSATLAGANSAQFTIDSASSGVITPGSFFDLVISYAATSPVTDDASVEITHDDTHPGTLNPIIINLTGTP